MLIVTKINTRTGTKSKAIIQSTNFTITAFDRADEAQDYREMYPAEEPFDDMGDGHFPPSNSYSSYGHNGGGQHTNKGQRAKPKPKKDDPKSVITFLDRESEFMYIAETVDEILVGKGIPQFIAKDTCEVDLT